MSDYFADQRQQAEKRRIDYALQQHEQDVNAVKCSLERERRERQSALDELGELEYEVEQLRVELDDLKKKLAAITAPSA